MKLLIKIAMILLCTSCSTIITQYEISKHGEIENPVSEGKIKSKIYSGTVFNIKAQATPEGGGGNIGGLFCLIDLPLSLVADTIILPYTVTYEACNREL